jgi:hypothetical protein
LANALGSKRDKRGVVGLADVEPRVDVRGAAANAPTTGATHAGGSITEA